MNQLHALEKVSPEQVGITSKSLIQFLDLLLDKKINLHSFMLLRNGKVAAEGFFKPFNANILHPIFSVSKSVTSTLVGIAIDEGLVSIEDRVIDFFPEKLSHPIHRYTSMMKIKHLLTMSTVHPRSTDTNVQDWVKVFLQTPPSHPPGTSFAYDTTGTHTLCAILQKVTGMTVHEYAKVKLFNRIGFGDIEWETCPMNIHKGGSGIKSRTEDLARFGLLCLQKGSWVGQQIVSKNWIEESTSKQIDNSSTRFLLDGQKGYGYQFWRGRNNSYCAFGMGGQFVLVIPEKDIVFVTTANTLLYKDGQQLILDSFWETIYPALADHPIDDDKDYQTLKQRLDDLVLLLPEGNGTSPLAPLISGKKLQFETNHLEFQFCQLELNEEKGRLCFYQEEKKTEISFGMKKWIIGSDPFFEHTCAGAGAWLDDQNLIIHIQLFDHLQMFHLICHVGDDFITIKMVPAGVLLTERLECTLTARKEQ